MVIDIPVVYCRKRQPIRTHQPTDGLHDSVMKGRILRIDGHYNERVSNHTMAVST